MTHSGGLLPYCIAAADAAVLPPATGVGGATVQELSESGLRCFYSAAGGPPGGAELREQALAFHAVLEAVFAAVAIIPFRFPTLLAGEDELRGYLRDHAADYGEALRRLRDAVQMEVRISKPRPSDGPGSGRDYLESRRHSAHTLAALAATVRQAVAGVTQDWREREGTHGIRCYCLIGRGQVEEFRRRCASLPAGEARTVVSGPWPASEFISEKVSA